MAAVPAAISPCCSSSCLSRAPPGGGGGGHLPSARRRRLKVTAMAPQKKVNRYDENWSKQWFGAGIFAEGSEEVEVDVFKKLEKRKVLSTVEKAGLLSKAEELGVTLSSLEELGLLSKAEDLGLLSLVETAAAVSPSVLASVSLPLLVAAIAAVVVVPDDRGGPTLWAGWDGRPSYVPSRPTPLKATSRLPSPATSLRFQRTTKTARGDSTASTNRDSSAARLRR